MMDREDGDLGAWEAGELTLEEAEARHPGGDIAAVAALHERLLAFGASPTPDPQLAWDRFESRLPTVPRAAAGERFRARRVLVAALAAAVLSGSAALAAPGTVRGWVDSIRHAINGVLGEGDEPPSASPTPPTGSGALLPPPVSHSAPEGDETDAGSDQEAPEGSDQDGDGQGADEEQGAPQDQGEADGSGGDESSAGESSGDSAQDEPSPTGTDDTRDSTD